MGIAGRGEDAGYLNRGPCVHFPIVIDRAGPSQGRLCLSDILQLPVDQTGGRHRLATL